MAVRVTRHLYSAEGFGVGEVWERAGVVVQHELASAAVVWDGSAAQAWELCARFVRHLAGERVEYGDVALDLGGVTPFQAALVEAARSVPWGEVVSYGELAALAGRPGAARAAGTFCAENRFALIVPCHRIVAADGIGGYGAGGVALKRRLLALEGVAL